ncbi:hypothetical protein [Listeria booriae]|uniref:hypothetical protein n=1 Tax=Listeria booriae TaxID=1552123 RepID=UPI001627D26B|nr:hypothetical protein [Listeria booriae]MBC1983037.1 hypothetical protein [Listeria booriae]
MKDIYGYFHHIITRPPRRGRKWAMEAFENYMKENEKMNKILVIDKDLDKKIKKLSRDMTLGELPLFWDMVSKMSENDLNRNNLTIDDFPRLFRKDYVVRKDYVIGQYYSACGDIFKVIGACKDDVTHVNIELYITDGDAYHASIELGFPSIYDDNVRPANKNEVKLFNRAKHFHKQNRMLNEFKDGDVVIGEMGIPFIYYPQLCEAPITTLKLVCTKEMRGDL